MNGGFGMKTPPDNILRYPLDSLLGSEAHVRLLRLLLHDVGAPCGVSDAAEWTGLSRAGARKALKRLTEAGFVTRIGSGRSQQYAVDADDPLLDALSRLFRAEEERYDSALKQLRSVFQGIPEIHAAWIRETPERPGEPLEISVVATSGALSWLKDDLRSRLREIEKHLDVIIEIGTYSRADAPEVDPAKVIPLAGVVDRGPNRTSSGEGLHTERDGRALRLSQEIATLLRSDPSLIRRAIRHIDRLLDDDQGAAAHDLLEWRQILQTYSVERLRDFLASESSRAARLRQSSPFFAVLTAEERDALVRRIEDTT